MYQSGNFRYKEMPKGKKQRKKDERAEREKAEKVKEEAKAELKAKLKVELAGAGARAPNPEGLPIFPEVFNEQIAIGIIRQTDFSDAAYVETSPDKSGRLRRAFKLYDVPDPRDEDDDRYVGNAKFWVGANAHHVTKDEDGRPMAKNDWRWVAGNSYILGYQDFKTPTPSTAVDAISNLPESKGDPPPGLWTQQ